MTEGGIFPWKLQKIKLPKSGGRPGTYDGLSRPLPDPPTGQTWVQDMSTREWKLISVVLASAHPVAVARLTKKCADESAVEDEDDGGGTATLAKAVPIGVESGIPVSVVDDGGAQTQYHEVVSTDTFQGICLRYNITPTELRRANKMMMGSSLTLAPDILIIPSNKKNQELDGGNTAARKCPTKEEKIAYLVLKVAHVTRDKLTHSEALAYLEMAEGDVALAIENVYDDFRWCVSGRK